MMKSVLLTLILFAMTTAQPSLHYTLSMPHPWSHLFEVRTEISGIASGSIDLRMPAWRTGRYMIFDFAGGVQEFTARTPNGTELAFHKTNKDTWRIATGNEKKIIVTYKVYANEFNQRTRELNSEHGFVDPASVMMFTPESKHLPLTLTVEPFGDWHVTTGLDEIEGKKNTFRASSFEHLIDSPLEIGRQQDFEFTAEGKKHIISIYGGGNWNSDTLIRDFKKIISANKEFWGDLPYQKYIFMIHCQPNAGGGTEHINSTVMGVKPFIFSNPNSYKGFLGLVSHEYFHTWNVKQLRPKAFVPYDLSTESYTEELWISEGMTSYFDELLLVYSGLAEGKSFIDQIPGMVSGDRSRPGNRVQPLSESSFDAWIKFWRGKENAFNAQSNYYSKGSHLSLLLDLEIRHRSNNAFSLHDVLKKMYQTFPRSKGFTNADFETVCEEFAGSSLKQFFADYLYGTTPLPWEHILRYAGLELTKKDSVQKSDLGISLEQRGGKTFISAVTPGSAGEQARLELNDEIAAVDGFRLQPAEITERIASLKPGAKITITLFRNDKLFEVTAVIGTLDNSGYFINKISAPTELQKSIYESWVHERF